MKIDPNDSRLTAFALGELEETEQEAIEHELLHSEAARQAVVEIRAAAEVLKEELGNEPRLQLSEAQRNVLHPFRSVVSFGNRSYLCRNQKEETREKARYRNNDVCFPRCHVVGSPALQKDSHCEARHGGCHCCVPDGAFQ